ncbi:MAG: PilZ domain-containing protein [Acidobacteriota bacterium]
MSFTEKRRHPRVNVNFLADWGWGPECEYYDRVTSLSPMGCFLATKRDLSRGDEIHLRLREETNGMINVKGAVRYQLRTMEGNPRRGAGVEFMGLTDDAQTKLQIVMNSYLQL